MIFLYDPIIHNLVFLFRELEFKDENPQVKTKKSKNFNL